MTSDYEPLTASCKAKVLAGAEETQTRTRPLFFVLMTHKSILVGSIILGILFFMALFGPLLSPYSFQETDLPHKNLSPSWEHIFGTDELGRDMWTRACMGLRI